MKFLRTTCFLGAVLAIGAAIAQTNGPAGMIETRIRSDAAEFDFKSKQAVYRGNVRLDDPRLKLTCDLLMANFGTNKQIEKIVAETNVVIDVVDETGITNHATGGRLVYTSTVEDGKTNELARLTALEGGPRPRVTTSNVRMDADLVVWDRATGKIVTDGNVEMIGFSDTATNNIPQSAPGTNGP